MTDEQIIKALEIHCNEKFDNCEGCPFLKGDFCTGFPVHSQPYRDVLDLINRQKAEIEKLKKESDEWARRFINRCRDYEFEIQQNEKLKAEIERLKNENFGLGTERDAAMECMDTAVIEAKSKAIREFAERLGNLTASYWLDNINQRDIDNRERRW